ncbi:hypothetical protein F422_gp051 [Staphylococcus phage SA11]|uniref:Uncharacterized protein n=1 Tax=Staphylococcus phage SA11 TaxID=2927988 RepID=I7DMX5_9CAUD|nr:hypothetical protein F422_gp051 [Staphylococcus phage SA11]AFO70638.1 hypothetical protein [Staphylococcus phage SA11]WCO82370.1 hypothetical protein PBSA08_015 [Staphylococcus phage PBSA08]WJZ48708.1 hypothetical protein SAC_77 [Staphylococcus phage SAC]
MVGMVITFLIVLGIILLSVLIIVIPDLSKAKKRKEDADINYSQYTKDMASEYYEKYITPTEHIIQTKVEEVIENIKKEYTVSTVTIDSSSNEDKIILHVNDKYLKKVVYKDTYEYIYDSNTKYQYIINNVTYESSILLKQDEVNKLKDILNKVPVTAKHTFKNELLNHRNEYVLGYITIYIYGDLTAKITKNGYVQNFSTLEDFCDKYEAYCRFVRIDLYDWVKEVRTINGYKLKVDIKPYFKITATKTSKYEFVVSNDVSNVKVYRDGILLTNRYVQKAIDIQEIVEETLNNNTVVF